MLVSDLGSEFYPVGQSENLRSVLHSGNQRFRETLEAWASIAKHVAVWDYWKIHQLTFPYTNTPHSQPDVQFFRDQRVGRLFIECEDRDEGSFAALKQWLGLKLMQNPDRSAPDLIRFFLRGYYGAAADCMGEYLAYLEKRIAETPGSLGRLRPTNWEYLTLPFFAQVDALLDRAEALAADSPACLAHVRRERVPVDCAMLHMWDQLQRTLPEGRQMPFDKPEVLARYEKHKSAALRSYYSGDPLARQLENLTNELRLFEAMPIPVPEQFRGRQVADLLWPDFTIGQLRVGDPEATAGIAVRLGPRPADPDFHVLPLTMGVHDQISGQAGPRVSLQQTDLAQDGKYHFYRLGTWPIGAQKTYVWVHWTWLIQIYLTKAYQPPLVETMDIYVSLKAVGPAYVKGSTDENSIYVDRIILVKPEGR